jgi:multidrug efflux pump subunit AcrA (membrane-fusion protein)
VAVAQSAVEPLRAAYERARKLYDQNQGIALGELQKREAELKAADGAVMTATATAVAASNRLQLLGMAPAQIVELQRSGTLDPRAIVRSPIDGQVIERAITLGELVTPEKDALLVVANVRTVWVLADVPETSLANVAEGATARVQVASVPGKSFEGNVSHIAAALDPHTRTAAVRIEVANDGALRPGMFARVELTGVPRSGVPRSGVSGSDADVLAIHESAVQTIDGEPHVFVPVTDEPNTFSPKPVRIGAPVNGMVPILAGVKVGDRVVVNGAFILKAELGKAEASHGH